MTCFHIINPYTSANYDVSSGLLIVKSDRHGLMLTRTLCDASDVDFLISYYKGLNADFCRLFLEPLFYISDERLKEKILGVTYLKARVMNLDYAKFYKFIECNARNYTVSVITALNNLWGNTV